MRKYLFVSVIASLFLISCVSGNKKESVDNVTDAKTSVLVTEDASEVDDYQFLVKVGDEAPDFEMEMPDGSFVKLSSLRGKVVMLQFTASWCGVCRKEMPYIESEIWQKHKDNPEFALYAIDREEPVEKIEEMIEATGVTYPIGLDPEADIFGIYAEKDAGITRNVIIDRDGKIVMLTRLFQEEEFNEMVKTIEKLLES